MELRTQEIDLGNGKKAVLKELTARAQMNADRAAKGDQTMIGYYRVLTSIISVTPAGGPEQKFDPPGNDLELDSRVDMFSGKELDDLANGYFTVFLGTAELKNESSALSPASSPQP